METPTRRDRLRTIGNAVVPQCAYEVGLFIKSITALGVP
jgi:hypothetical protein